MDQPKVFKEEQIARMKRNKEEAIRKRAEKTGLSVEQLHMIDRNRQNAKNIREEKERVQNDSHVAMALHRETEIIGSDITNDATLQHNTTTSGINNDLPIVEECNESNREQDETEKEELGQLDVFSELEKCFKSDKDFDEERDPVLKRINDMDRETSYSDVTDEESDQSGECDENMDVDQEQAFNWDMPPSPITRDYSTFIYPLIHKWGDGYDWGNESPAMMRNILTERIKVLSTRETFDECQSEWKFIKIYGHVSFKEVREFDGRVTKSKRLTEDIKSKLRVKAIETDNSLEDKKIIKYNNAYENKKWIPSTRCVCTNEISQMVVIQNKNTCIRTFVGFDCIERFDCNPRLLTLARNAISDWENEKRGEPCIRRCTVCLTSSLGRYKDKNRTVCNRCADNKH